ncbi:hypothetical protein [Salinisphaera sp. T5B8]|uniref:hypothetical protein n=1 Tax=Salinisphaera sp. T5B8 TaxID=1304154 RepID=UPI00333F52BF
MHETVPTPCRPGYFLRTLQMLRVLATVIFISPSALAVGRNRDARLYSLLPIPTLRDIAGIRQQQCNNA